MNVSPLQTLEPTPGRPAVQATFHANAQQITGACIVLACLAAFAPSQEPIVRPGLDVLLADSSHLVTGRRVGLITNQTAVARDGTHAIDLLLGRNLQLVSLFSPEHGIRGEVEGGERIESSFDQRSGLPIHSLYGDTRKPTPETLSDIDVLLFDIQDIGARYYTYVSTMALAMQAAAEAHIPFIVLDRPNPIGGDLVGGNVLEPEHASFVGLYPVPMRHGMTAGELARLINDHHEVGADLTVIPAAGWKRATWLDDTDLPWVRPSPNMPSLESAAHYPGTCLFEGTNLSVGRGTDEAFQQIGAPWLEGAVLAQRLNSYELSGVRFEPVTFTPDRPDDNKYGGELLSGVRFIATDRTTYDPTLAATAALIEARQLAGDRWQWRAPQFDRLAGTTQLRARIEAGARLDELAAIWRSQLDTFMPLRSRYLLY